ncbi:MAG: leucine-rich repeat protein [Firmicutes bacterium]|nr:leucine-rich repeat protein [[Eubacterium] siraeum]MCM1488921.1 leucine-rich repeat protein [Bacillota bacterium]
MKKIMPFVISLSLSLSLLSVNAEADGRTFTVGDYVYEEDDGELEIVSYSGSEAEVTVPDSINGVRVTKIDDRAFYNNTALSAVTVPQGVKEIGEYAFYGCTALTVVSLPLTLEEIDEYAFSGCSSLSEITIPSSVRDIGDGAFSRNPALTEMTFPEGVRELGDNDGIEGVCYSCANLTSVSLPSTLTELNPNSFDSCTSLTQVAYNGTKDQWDRLLRQNNISSVAFDQKLSFAAGQGNSQPPANTQAPVNSQAPADNPAPADAQPPAVSQAPSENPTPAENPIGSQAPAENQAAVTESVNTLPPVTQADTAGNARETLSDRELMELYQQQNDETIKNILVIQGIAIGALLVILIAVMLLSFVKKQSKKKANEEKQAAYDREKKDE